MARKSQVKRELRRARSSSQKSCSDSIDKNTGGTGRRVISGEPSEVDTSNGRRIPDEEGPVTSSTEKNCMEKPGPAALALEYLDLAERYPLDCPVVTVGFHLRRMLKPLLDKYQLLGRLQEIVLASSSQINNIAAEEDTDTVNTIKDPRAGTLAAFRTEIVGEIDAYEKKAREFVFDPRKAERERLLAAEKKKEAEARQKFEKRMERKAKREGKASDFYLESFRVCFPCQTDVDAVRAIPDTAGRKAKWKARFAAFCFDHCVLGRCRFASAQDKGSLKNDAPSSSSEAKAASCCPFRHIDVASGAGGAGFSGESFVGDSFDECSPRRRSGRENTMAQQPSWLQENFES